jgi:hypothetical protein
MEIQSISAIIGAACLGFAAIGAFLLIPDRELTIREKIGIHTIFWAFVIYAEWIIYNVVWTDSNWNSFDKYYYIAFPLLLGLLLSLLSEFTSKQPPINIEDRRIKKLTLQTWKRLPNNVRRALQNTIMSVQAIPDWSDVDRESLKPMKADAAKWFPILPFPAMGILHVSLADCSNLNDSVITGSLVNEFSIAYQSTRTPFDTDLINKSPNTLPLKWGFKKEMEAYKIKIGIGHQAVLSELFS